MTKYKLRVAQWNVLKHLLFSLSFLVIISSNLLWNVFTLEWWKLLTLVPGKTSQNRARKVEIHIFLLWALDPITKTFDSYKYIQRNGYPNSTLNLNCGTSLLKKTKQTNFNIPLQIIIRISIKRTIRLWSVFNLYFQNKYLNAVCCNTCITIKTQQYFGFIPDIAKI